MGQDTNPMVWGAMDRFQAHFIVRLDGGSDSHELAARTVVQTSGWFGSKRIVGIRWRGAGALADRLNSDDELNAMIAARPLQDSDIFVEPTESGVRIHGPWRALHEFGIGSDEFAIYDKIAAHIKSA